MRHKVAFDEVIVLVALISSVVAVYSKVKEHQELMWWVILTF
jgi:hypothetical protein